MNPTHTGEGTRSVVGHAGRDCRPSTWRLCLGQHFGDRTPLEHDPYPIKPREITAPEPVRIRPCTPGSPQPLSKAATSAMCLRKWDSWGILVYPRDSVKPNAATGGHHHVADLAMSQRNSSRTSPGVHCSSTIMEELPTNNRAVAGSNPASGPESGVLDGEERRLFQNTVTHRDSRERPAFL